MLFGVVIGILLALFAVSFRDDGGDLTQLVGAVFDGAARAALPNETISGATAFAVVAVFVVGVIIGIFRLDTATGVMLTAMTAAVLVLITLSVVGKVGILFIASFALGLFYGHKAGMPVLIGVVVGVILAVFGGGVVLAAAYSG